MKKIRLGSGSAYWGDMLEPAIDLIEKGELDYIGFDHLAELTMSILQRMKDKDPKKGYIPDIVPWMKAILPIAHKKGVKIITNAGGVNPEAAAEEVLKIAKDNGIEDIKIAVIKGDDVKEQVLDMIANGEQLINMDTGESNIDEVADRIVAANAYIGADKIVEALQQGADVVIAGRISDNAVYVGPMMYEFGWDFSDPYWNKIGAGVTVGHVIECAENCSGGLSNLWDKIPHPERIGFPIAEVYEDGTAIITKAEETGGLVNEWTIKEQLTYEITDPANYKMPDAIADFTSIKVEDLGQDRVRLTNMSGKPRPETLKVQIGYRDGFIGEGQAFFAWPDAFKKAQQAEKFVRDRFEIIGLKAEELYFEYLGVNTLMGSVSSKPEDQENLNEVGLRVSARTKTREEADKVRREVTHLWTMGGLGSAVGVPHSPRQVISLYPTLIPREKIKLELIIKEVKELCY
jgi:hypothetical protein